MKKKDDQYILSASDIANYLVCKRATQLDTEVANGRLEAPEFYDSHVKVMQERGFENERNYVGHRFNSRHLHQYLEGYKLYDEKSRKHAEALIQDIFKTILNNYLASNYSK
jgi:hypothetical protein